MSLVKAANHLKMIHKHRKLVRKGCFFLGLYWQGMTHDLSKYSWTEFRIGAKYYTDNKSPHNGERKEYGYSTAWLHHKGRNKHHMEYWIDFSYTGDHHITGVRMPEKYVAEMFVDRISASKLYLKDQYTTASPLAYYNEKKKYHIIDDQTAALLELLLVMLKEQGEKPTLIYIREQVLKKGYQVLDYETDEKK